MRTSALDLLPDRRSPTLPSQIRFTRLGRIRSPFYRIIAIDSRKRRDGAPLEVRARPPQPTRSPPFFAPSRSTPLGRTEKWISAELGSSIAVPNASLTSEPLLFFSSPTGARMVRPYQKAVEPQRPRHQGVAGEGRAALGDCGRASQEVPHHREVNRASGCFGGDGRRGTGTTHRREVSRGLRSGWISRARGV